MRSEIEELEKRPDIKQVWFATPDLSNDSGERPGFKEAVKTNAARGVKYTMIFPKHMSQEQQPELQEFRDLFPLNKATGVPSGLTEISLNASEFQRLMPHRIPTHIVIFNPHLKNNKLADVYMEMLDEQLWRKMGGEEANKTLDRFTKLVKRHS